MVSPSSLTLSQNSSGTVAIATTVTSGSTQSVAFTISGLPGYVTAIFAPPAILAGNDSILTLAAGNTLPGTYTLTISASGALGITHTANVSLTITESDFSL